MLKACCSANVRLYIKALFPEGAEGGTTLIVWDVMLLQEARHTRV